MKKCIEKRISEQPVNQLVIAGDGCLIVFDFLLLKSVCVSKCQGIKDHSILQTFNRVIYE